MVFCQTCNLYKFSDSDNSGKTKWFILPIEKIKNKKPPYDCNTLITCNNFIGGHTSSTPVLNSQGTKMITYGSNHNHLVSFLDEVLTWPDRKG